MSMGRALAAACLLTALVLLSCPPGLYASSGHGNATWALGDREAQVASSNTSAPLAIIPGMLQVWGGFEGESKRAYLMVGDLVFRLLNWEQFQDKPGFGTDAAVTVTGYRVPGPVMDFLNLQTLRVDEPKPAVLDPVRPELSRRRRLLDGAVPAKGLNILVVRVMLPGDCAPLLTLTGSCDEAKWTQTLWTDADSLSKEQETCTWGAITYDRASSQIVTVVIPCTPLKSTVAGYCGDEQMVWMAHANTQLKAQGTNVMAFDHVIYDIPKVSCYWSGASTVPGNWVLMNAMCGKGVIIHELGHNYGLDHSNVLSASGVLSEYRDYSCEMGAGTGGGADSKCYSLPWMHLLGVAQPREVTSDSLRPGRSVMFNISVTWMGPAEGIVIDIASFGINTPSKYYISLQADSGPQASLKDMYFYTQAGVVPTIYRKVVLVHRMPLSASDDGNARLAVLGANSKWKLSDIGLVIRPESFAQDGSSVVVSICRIGDGSTCGQPLTKPIPEQYWQLRPGAELKQAPGSSADQVYCLAVCMEPAGSSCQPGGYITSQQRQVIFDATCSTVSPGDGSALWYFDGLLIRNKLTGWCLDPILAQNSSNPGPLVVRPCLDNGDNAGDSPIQQMWLWGQLPGTRLSLSSQSLTYFTVPEVNRFVSRWVKALPGSCPSMCNSPGASCFNLMPNGGNSRVFAYGGACSDVSSIFPISSSVTFTPAEVGVFPEPPPPPQQVAANLSVSGEPPPSPPTAGSTSKIILKCRGRIAAPMPATLCKEVIKALKVAASDSGSISTTCTITEKSELNVTMVHSGSKGSSIVLNEAQMPEFWGRLFLPLEGRCSCQQAGSFEGFDKKGGAASATGCAKAACQVVSGCPVVPSLDGSSPAPSPKPPKKLKSPPPSPSKKHQHGPSRRT